MKATHGAEERSMHGEDSTIGGNLVVAARGRVDGHADDRRVEFESSDGSMKGSVDGE